MIKISEAFDKSWNDIKDNLPLVAGLSLVFFFAIGASSFVPFMGAFIGAPLAAGYKYCLIKIRNKQEIGYQDFFWCFLDFNRFLQMTVMTFITLFLTIVLCFCLLLPGIWYAVAVSLSTSYFVLDGGKDGIAAIKKSTAAIKGHWWYFFLACLFAGVLSLAGMICFVIGLLLTTPIISLMFLHFAEAQKTLEPSAPQQNGQNSDASFLTVNPN